MNLPLSLLGVLGLACFRITSLLVYEAGPLDVFHRIRKWAGIRYDKNSNKIADGELGRMLLCPWCTSLWVGIGLTVLYAISPPLMFWIALPFSLSGICVIVQELLNVFQRVSEWLDHNIEHS